MTPALNRLQQEEIMRQALEVIAVGDSKSPEQDARDALVEIGFWGPEAKVAPPARAGATDASVFLAGGCHEQRSAEALFD